MEYMKFCFSSQFRLHYAQLHCKMGGEPHNLYNLLWARNPCMSCTQNEGRRTKSWKSLERAKSILRVWFWIPARCYLRRLQCTVEKPLHVLNPKMGGEDLQVRNPMRESMILVFNPCGTKMGAEESHWRLLPMGLLNEQDQLRRHRHHGTLCYNVPLDSSKWGECSDSND